MKKAALSMLSWDQVKLNVEAVNPDLAAIINKLKLKKDHLLAKASYPYGSLVMKKSLLMLPNSEGEIVPITSDSIDGKIRAALDYNLESNPVSLVLKNSFEIFLPLNDRTIPLSGLIVPGTAFGAWRVLNPAKAENPAFIWDMTAGARSIFMMPKITETLRHNTLKNTYDLVEDVPRSLMRHWEVFKEIASHSRFKQDWDAEILYFTEAWFKNLDDPSWFEFYNYFKKSSWGATEFWRNQPIYNLIFSLILGEYEGKPSAYAMDTVKYIVHVAMGALPGLAPATDNLAGPFSEIQRIYEKEYGLHYAPVILQPTLFNAQNDQQSPVYYSLNFPNALEFKPNSRAKTNLLTDLREIKSLIVRYERELLSGKFNINNTSLDNVFKAVKFDYFHTGSGATSMGGIRDSNEMMQQDPYLRKSLQGKEYKRHPNKVLFLNGCIRLSLKSQNI